VRDIGAARELTRVAAETDFGEEAHRFLEDVTFAFEAGQTPLGGRRIRRLGSYASTSSRFRWHGSRRWSRVAC
jgi:hypothetical protein